MAYQGKHVHGWPCQMHAQVTGYVATDGAHVDCSMITWALIQRHMPKCYSISYAYCVGTWCDTDNQAWLDANVHNADHVLRVKLERSNGRCYCCGVSGGLYPPADYNSLLLTLTDSRLAGHVHFRVAQKIAASGLPALLQGGAPGNRPMCQLFGRTNTNVFVGGGGPRPRAVAMDMYVFGPDTPQFNNTMQNLSQGLQQLRQLYEPAAMYPNPSLQAIPLAHVPIDIRNHDV